MRAESVPSLARQRGSPHVVWSNRHLTGHAAAVMEYMVACSEAKLLEALCAFVDQLI